MVLLHYVCLGYLCEDNSFFQSRLLSVWLFMGQGPPHR